MMLDREEQREVRSGRTEYNELGEEELIFYVCCSNGSETAEISVLSNSFPSSYTLFSIRLFVLEYVIV